MHRTLAAHQVVSTASDAVTGGGGLAVDGIRDDMYV